MFRTSTNRSLSTVSNTTIGIADNIDISNKYHYINSQPFTWAVFAHDFPYSFFVHRRKRDRPEVLPYQKELPSDFESKLWNFDNSLLAFG